jgi:hypothetical protein
MLRLTCEETEVDRTAKGGFTRKQLEAWGVSWSPRKGWRYELETGLKYIPEIERPEYAEMLSMRQLYEKSPTLHNTPWHFVV